MPSTIEAFLSLLMKGAPASQVYSWLYSVNNDWFKILTIKLAGLYKQLLVPNQSCIISTEVSWEDNFDILKALKKQRGCRIKNSRQD